MLQIIYGLILWIIVPGIILSLFIFGLVICANAYERVSARAGFALGLLLFVLYVIYELPLLQNINFTAPSFSGFGPDTWILLMGGGVTGIFLFALVRLFIPNRGVGVVVGILTVSSTCALFSYFFVENTKNMAIFLALGLVGGLLIHLIFFPDTLAKIFHTNYRLHS